MDPNVVVSWWPSAQVSPWAGLLRPFRPSETRRHARDVTRLRKRAKSEWGTPAIRQPRFDRRAVENPPGSSWPLVHDNLCAESSRRDSSLARRWACGSSKASKRTRRPASPSESSRGGTGTLPPPPSSNRACGFPAHGLPENLWRTAIACRLSHSPQSASW